MFYILLGIWVTLIYVFEKWIKCYTYDFCISLNVNVTLKIPLSKKKKKSIGYQNLQDAPPPFKAGTQKQGRRGLVPLPVFTISTYSSMTLPKSQDKSEHFRCLPNSCTIRYWYPRF